MASLPYPRSLLTVISSHRIHRSAQKLLVEKGLPQISQICTEPSCCDFLPQNSQNSQNLLVEKGLPHIARIYTDVGGYGILPYPRNH